MLLDANEFESGSVVETDLCIAGAGAAGITLALQFVDSKTSVVLLEGGGENRSLESQNIYAGTCDEPLADTYPLMSRLRHLGGTTNHWLGACPMLDPIDFSTREWIPDSGWPFDRSEVFPYYRRAAGVVGLDPPADDERDPPPYEGSVFSSRRSRVQVTRFAEKYRQPLAAARNLRLLLHANVIRVGLHEGAGSVEQLDVATFGGRRFAVRARCFVLALGGIENSRMLLVSDDVQAGGVGNGHDVVGRYFMDHARYPVAEVCVSDRDRGLLHRLPGHGTFRLNGEAQRRRRLLNCGLMFGAVPEIEDTRHFLLRDGAWERLAPYLEEEGVLPESSVLGRLAKHAGGEDKLFYRRFSLLPEQPPTPDSRMMLGSVEDPFGNRRVHIRWTQPPEMRRTALETVELFAAELGRQGLGRVAVDIEALEDVYQPGFHHMGGTRMQADPRRGVVDSRCRVHGVANLYLAGSSVFPTSGYANPTFTIVALALRLADHLVSRLGRAA